MPGYVPVTPAVATVTLTAAARIDAGDPLVIAAPGQVRRNALAGLPAPYIGVAANDAEPGQAVTVHVGQCIHEGRSQGPVTAGDLLLAGWVAGRQVLTCPAPPPVPSGTDVWVARSVVGVAVTTAADGELVRWQSWH